MNGRDNFRRFDAKGVEQLFNNHVAATHTASLVQYDAASLLSDAAAIVGGDRNKTHGKPERSFETIAAYWTVYLDNRLDRDAPLRGSDVAGMMELLKLARDQQHVAAFRDHALDGAGYAAIRGELRAKECA